MRNADTSEAKFTTERVFARYRPLIDDWTAFQAALQQDLPVCIWTNNLRTSPERLGELLKEEGIPFAPLPWHPSAFRLTAAANPGRHWPFLAGLYHIQEEASIIPAVLLNPRPGERVLDLCAAPGNKSAQMAIMMGGRGTVIANDVSFVRLRAARQNFDRLGLVNAVLTHYDATVYPHESGSFDKVLVDVPCSCEGTSRKNPQVLKRVGGSEARSRAGLQAGLLRTAVRLCKTGGRIVYSTCTYAPEENEAVVDMLLRECGEQCLRLLPAAIDGLTSSPGLGEWQGRQFHPSLSKTLRLWPHQNDSGGFFVAVLEKTGPGEDCCVAPTSQEKAAEGCELHSHDFKTHRIPAESVREFAKWRFGIDERAFKDLAFFQTGKDGIFVARDDLALPSRPKQHAAGMLFARSGRRIVPKITAEGGCAFGGRAQRNVIELNREQLQRYIARQDNPIDAEQSANCSGHGYVIVRYHEFAFGVGYLHISDGGEAVLESMFPKAMMPRQIAAGA